MDLDAVQTRLVNSKVVPYSVLRGAAGAGKTTAAFHRMIYLKNNYCLYDEDKILMITENNHRLDEMKKTYYGIEREEEYNYITLFSNQVDKVHLNTMEDIIERYFIDFKKKHNIQYSLLVDNLRIKEIMYKSIEENKKKYPLVRMMNCDNVSFFIEEISWIKSCNYLDLVNYQEANRLGRKVEKGKGPTRLLKNSLEREVIYQLMLIYNKMLREKGFIDKEDRALMALQQAKNEKLYAYTHLIIDESQSYTRVELDLLREIKNDKSYCSIIYIYEKEGFQASNAWLIKGRSFSKLFLEEKPKSFLFSKKYEQVGISHNEDMRLQKKDNSKVLDSFKYLDIRHQKSFIFKRDIGNMTELILGEDNDSDILKAEELVELSVFNDIAAGEPIFINPEVEENFYLPNYWLKGMKECFMLKVKGDSMINAGIEDGDFVVIRRQSMAQNRDIVAVDLEGSATLKRLKIEKDGVFLIPENEKYKIIPISEDGARIIGVAVGIIKKN